MDLESIKRDFISKRVISAVSYLQQFFKLKPDKKLWCALLQVLNDVHDYFHSLPFYAKVDFIQDPFVLCISNCVPNVEPNSCLKSFLDRQEQEWLYFSFSAHCRPKMRYNELLDAFSKHNGYTPNNVTTDEEKRLYFDKTLHHLVNVNKVQGEVHPRPMIDLMDHPVLNKDTFKYYGLETLPAGESKITFVEQNASAVKRLESTNIWCKNNVVYKKLGTIIRFLLDSFGSLSCGQLKKCISYLWPDIKIFLDEISTEKQSEVFSSIAPTALKSDDLYLLPPPMTCKLEWVFATKRKLYEVHIVCYLALHGETNYFNLLKFLVSSSLEENILGSTPEKTRWCRYLTKESELWEFTERNSLKLLSSFYFGSISSESGSLKTMTHCSFQQEMENIESSMKGIALHAEVQNARGTESERSASKSGICDEDAMLSTYVSNRTYPCKSTMYHEIPIITDKKKVRCPDGDLVSGIARNAMFPKSNAVNDKAVPQTCPSERNVCKTESVCSKGQLMRLSQSLQGCITYLLQFFKLNLNSGFFEVVLQVLDSHVTFSMLPHPQQREVVKKSFHPFHVDRQGRVIADPSAQPKQDLLTKEIAENLCVSFIVSQHGEQNYSEVFSKYKVYVKSKVHLKSPEELDYFKRRKDLFKVNNDGCVSLQTTPSVEWDYASFVMSEHRRIPLRIFGRIKESAIILGKNFDVVSAEQMMRAILYILRDLYPYLVAKSDYHKSIVKEVHFYYESERSTVIQGEKPTVEMVNFKNEEKDLLVLACVLVSSGAMHCDKLFDKRVAHGRSAESMAKRSLRPSFEKKQNYFAVDYLKNVKLKGEIPTALNLDTFFKDMDLKASFQSDAMTSRKFKSADSSIQHTALCMIYDVCRDVLSSKMTRQGNTNCQGKEAPGSKSNNTGPSFGGVDDIHSQSKNNFVSQTSVDGTFMNNGHFEKDIFEGDKSYYNNLIDSFLYI